MEFHEYTPIKRRVLQNADPAAKQHYKSFNSSRFRGTIIKEVMAGHNDLRGWGYQAEAEGIWAEHERPFYNVWPIAVSLSQDVKLHLPFSTVELPFDALLLRFANGYEPLGLCTALLDWRHKDSMIRVHAFAGTKDELFFWEGYKPSEIVEDWLDKLLARPQYGDDWKERKTPDATGLSRMGLLIRLVVFIALLARDRDVITPIVLSKDRSKYESTDDPDVKKWLEDRASRRAGRGFDVAKKLQAERESSPHWRNPHLALFWTGTGRTVPVIKMRSGSVVQRVSMAEVPTGYIGPETDDEDTLDEATAQCEPVPKSKRFEIMKRDGYMCQLCGRSQEDGVKLHVDHRTPRAKGGSNEDENLWTLCEDCNLGKSDRDL